MISGLFQIKEGKKQLIDGKSSKVIFSQKPRPRSSSCLVVFSHFLILFAGELATGEETNELWLFDLRNFEWQQVMVKGSDLKARRGHACMIFDTSFNYLLVFGGVAKGVYLSDLVILRIVLTGNSITVTSATNEFKLEGDEPEAREGSSFMSINQKPGFCCGCNYLRSICFNDLYFLTFTENSILLTKQVLPVQPQEKVLILPALHGFYFFPGHDTTNQHIKSGYLISCTSECSENGIFVNNLCICNTHYFGESCKLKCVHGNVLDGTCICKEGFSPPSCEFFDSAVSFVQSFCDKNCHNKGNCLANTCHCLPGHFGDTCEFTYCQGNCGGEKARGVCDHEKGKCMCFEGYGGNNCEFHCPGGCGADKICTGNGVCECFDCEHNDCNNHGTLIENTCHCMPNYCGTHCEHMCERCSGHGTYTGTCCECYPGFYGETCSFHCPNECSSHGICKSGVCICSAGWEGEDCSKSSTCSNCQNGLCINNQCICYKGYGGESCSLTLCPNNCTILSYHYETQTNPVKIFNSLEEIPEKYSKDLREIISTAGNCNLDLQVCECFHGFTGIDCSVATSCQNCVNGYCDQGKCLCFDGFYGPTCEVKQCPKMCSGNGICYEGNCDCSGMWNGRDCSVCKCRHGECDGVGCKCFKGFDGELCEDRICDRCGNGVCVEDLCVCQAGYSGMHCETCIDSSICGACKSSSDCNTGTCLSGTCHCPPRYSGKHCEVSPCSSHGVLSHKSCICDEGYYGEDCSHSITCANNCSNHGICHAGLCYCEPEYTGADCSLAKACPENCNSNGKCIQGKCFCFKGFQGPSCQSADSCASCSCPCVMGRCLCDQKLIQQACPFECSKHGNCVGGKCVCFEEWTGEHCQVQVVVDNQKFCLSGGVECSEHGECVHGRCKCLDGFEGDFCEKASCKSCTLPNHQCIDGKCVCAAGYTGDSCTSSNSCTSKDCGEFGTCSEGRCLCQFGYSPSGPGPCSPAITELCLIGLLISVIYGAVIYLVLRLNSNK